MKKGWFLMIFNIFHWPYFFSDFYLWLIEKMYFFMYFSKRKKKKSFLQGVRGKEWYSLNAYSPKNISEFHTFFFFLEEKSILNILVIKTRRNYHIFEICNINLKYLNLAKNLIFLSIARKSNLRDIMWTTKRCQIKFWTNHNLCNFTKKMLKKLKMRNISIF